MKIFDRLTKFERKVNFVDENNVFVGYDLQQQCCENAGWFISDKIYKRVPSIQRKDLEECDLYVFDAEFSKSFDAKCQQNIVVFKLVNGEKTKYLHLYNVSNGWYSHGFEFKINGKIKKKGLL
jgi:hypothetical protein